MRTQLIPSQVQTAQFRVGRLAHVLVRSQSVQTAEAPVQQKLQQKDQERIPEQQRQAATQPQQLRNSPRINVIPHSQWPSGVPPVMGAHLMPSGEVAPLSTSKGAGLGGIPHSFHYADKQVDADVVQYVNAEAGAQGLARVVRHAANEAIKAKGSFTLVLSGGSLLKGLTALTRNKGVDYSKWHIFYVDERNVPHSHADSTHKGAVEAFLSKVDIPQGQIFIINGITVQDKSARISIAYGALTCPPRPDWVNRPVQANAGTVHAIKEGLPVEEAATEYAGQLLGLAQSVLPRNSGGLPIFDLILLGLGPDGHVASLFPNRSQTAATDGPWVLPVSDSPKPPPKRITMTMPVINAAKEVIIVAFGAGKAEIVQRALEVQALPGSLPAQLVRPSAGPLTWYVDAESAQQLRIEAWENSKEYPRNA